MEEYLTITELAARLKTTPKNIRNKTAKGIFRKGIHFVRPKGFGPRFKWSQIEAWLEGTDIDAADEGAGIPMLRGYRMRKSLTEEPGGNIDGADGMQGHR